ncbi:MAG: PBP1A family penicillin-binding protein [Acidobacteria bacterium]|nr:PBP1A family penicillin-binding protein [Acidobacteriota bacterium]
MAPRKEQKRNRSHFKAKVAAVVLLTPLLAGTLVFLHYYHKYDRLIERRLRDTSWKRSTVIYAAPWVLQAGQQVLPSELENRLRLIGYSKGIRTGKLEFEWKSPTLIDIANADPGLNRGITRVRVEIQEGRIRRLMEARGKAWVSSFALEAEPISNLFDETREKRRYTRFQDFSPHLVNAVIAGEDKRFYTHSGLDPFRILKAAFVDVRQQELAQGGSTITQQLVKNFFLTRERTLKRKLQDSFMAVILERKLSKEEIFELYANEVYMGQRGSFSIVGFSEAAEAYFHKNVKDLQTHEAALLTAIIPAPNRFSPYKQPRVALARRDRVLDVMEELGLITARQKVDAKKQPLGVQPLNIVNVSDAPYFVDHIRDQLTQKYSEEELMQPQRIYGTLNLALQRAAFDAINEGLIELDQVLAKRKRDPVPRGTVQAVLIAMDQGTGEVLALVGGRNYGLSQYNRAVEARRQPGSIFKPFVYAAALEMAFDNPYEAITSTTTVVDEPTTFYYEDKLYEPKNYGEKYLGPVNLRQALKHSLNVATLKFAERTGYEKIVQLVQAAGLGKEIKPYPSVALGSFEVTPLDMTAAFTSFANGGIAVAPITVRKIVDSTGRVLEQSKVQHRQVIHPETAYLMTNLMESVIESGTGAGVRARGFSLPAAGKTGTSHDGWFAGYTPELLCVVWVGFDDHRELGLEGARSALPIWTAFMKRAQGIVPLRGRGFEMPEGVLSLDVDTATGLLATPDCPERRNEVFIAGTEPTTLCNGPHLMTASQPN